MDSTDFKEFLETLKKKQGEFLVVGAYAMSAWGYVRATGDLDILINPTKQNSERVFSALQEFGAPLTGVTAHDFATKGTIYQMGLPPLRIDLLTTIDGVEFTEAFQAKTDAPLLGVSVPILSLEHLIQNKTATSREKDKADIEELKKLATQKKK